MYCIVFALDGKTTCQPHNIVLVDRRTNLLETLSVGSAIHGLCRRVGDGVIGVGGNEARLRVNAVLDCGLLECLDGRIQSIVPELVVGRVGPCKVQVKLGRKRSASARQKERVSAKEMGTHRKGRVRVRICAVGCVLAVCKEGLDVVAHKCTTVSEHLLAEALPNLSVKEK